MSGLKEVSMAKKKTAKVPAGTSGEIWFAAAEVE
jgi:hypothetical protein